MASLIKRLVCIMPFCGLHCNERIYLANTTPKLPSILGQHTAFLSIRWREKRGNEGNGRNREKKEKKEISIFFVRGNRGIESRSTEVTIPVVLINQRRGGILGRD